MDLEDSSNPQEALLTSLDEKNMNPNVMQDIEYVPMAVELAVSDFQTSLKFYRDVLGFTLLRINEEEQFAPFQFGKSILMIMQIPSKGLSDFQGNSVIVRFILEKGIHDYFEKVKSRGAKIFKPIETMPYGLTRFYVLDPDGYRIKFCQRE